MIYRKTFFIAIFALLVSLLTFNSCDLFEEVRKEKEKVAAFNKQMHDIAISDWPPESKIQKYKTLLGEIKKNIKSDKLKPEPTILCYNYINLYNFKLGKTEDVIDY